MTTRLGVVMMTALLALYIWLVSDRAIALIRVGIDEDEPVATMMGVAIIVIPLVAIWGIGRELWFGIRGQQLAKRLEAEGALPHETVGTMPSGRVQREDAAVLFPRYKAAVEADENNWRPWFRLSIVYDAAGDRKRARAAARQAMRLERESRDSAAR